MFPIPEYVDGLPNLSGSEDLIERTPATTETTRGTRSRLPGGVLGPEQCYEVFEACFVFFEVLLPDSLLRSIDAGASFRPQQWIGDITGHRE